MHPGACDLAHPHLQALIADEDIHELLARHEVALDIVDAIFHFTLVLLIPN